MGNKTAAQIAAEWRAHAAALRKRAGNMDGRRELILLAQANAYEECARQIMTDLHGMGMK